MRKDLLGKTLVLSVIFLFIGIGVQPAFANDNTFGNAEQKLDDKFSIDSNPVNPLGGTFKKTFGGTDDEEGMCVQQTSDGGYIVTGFTWSFGAGLEDVWLIKIDSLGNMVWDKTFGGADNDRGNCVQQTSDGGYIIIGVKDEYPGSEESNVWLIKTDSDGNMIWDRTFGGTDDEEGMCVQQTSDGGYIITGFTWSFGVGGCDVWLIKTDSDGNMIWDKTFGGTGLEYGRCVRQTTDGGYIITGETFTFGAGWCDIWLIKTDSAGNKEWDRTFGGIYRDYGTCVQQTTDGGYILTGYSERYYEIEFLDSNIWLIKTDSDGNTIWHKIFDKTDYDYGFFVRQTTDGGYIIVGKVGTGFGYDVWLIKTDSAGDKIWDRRFGGLFSYEIGNCVQQTSDGGYILVGDYDSYNEFSDILLIKTNEYGRVSYKSINNPILNFLQSHPNMFPILQKLILFINCE